MKNYAALIGISVIGIVVIFAYTRTSAFNTHAASPIGVSTDPQIASGLRTTSVFNADDALQAATNWSDQNLDPMSMMGI